VAHPEGHDVAAVDDLLAEQVAYYRRRASEYDMTAYGDVDAARARITRVVAALRPAGNVLEKSSSGGSATAPSTDWSRSSSIPASWAPGCTSLAGRATSAGTAMTGSSARHAPANRNGRTLGTQPAAPFWRIPEPLPYWTSAATATVGRATELDPGGQVVSGGGPGRLVAVHHRQVPAEQITS
jgi:hypothetical protein